MSKAGRKATRVCSNATYYLSSEAQVKLLKLSKGRMSAYLDNLIIETYASQFKDWKQEDQEVDAILYSDNRESIKTPQETQVTATEKGGKQGNSLFRQ